ncbi:NAD(P)/FAD-dependent oxidoreductase [Paenibacillus illinoisensis]|uniref:NAD(P)/FAD-dependent oxidoreductase n=1 Tax=Paenibacillus illinoisensis TaxID=59845 RepID=UPI00289C2CB1|nr:NAD(P)/FAD-dependent oxidoreductase [Paenibacillus illinoisensis]MBY0217826.1 NAD(P)/FAD-dependent oxidoreductase [Paenibacillus illinoisensis]
MSLSQDTDMIIIGGGPAGMFASFYAGMRNASVKLIESLPQLGGQLAALYPDKYIYDIAGFPRITAQELVDHLRAQMSRFPIDIRLGVQVLNVVKHEERRFEVITSEGVHFARAVIIAGGVDAFQPRRIELPGARKYEETNLHYSIQDLNSFKDKKILINGGGDSAVDWALMLQEIAAKVMVVHRRDKFRAHEHSVNKLMNASIEVKTPWEITNLDGGTSIKKVMLAHCKTMETEVVEVDEVIINFGYLSSLGPIAEWGIELEDGSIVVNSRMESNVSGIFAAGDITTYPGKLKLIAVGFGEAPTAVNNAMVYINPDAKLSPGHSSHMKLIGAN